MMNPEIRKPVGSSYLAIRRPFQSKNTGPRTPGRRIPRIDLLCHCEGGRWPAATVHGTATPALHHMIVVQRRHRDYPSWRCELHLKETPHLRSVLSVMGPQACQGSRQASCCTFHTVRPPAISGPRVSLGKVHHKLDWIAPVGLHEECLSSMNDRNRHGTISSIPRSTFLNAVDSMLSRMQNSQTRTSRRRL